MDHTEFFIELEEPLRRITCGINAMELMVMGLGQAKDPYTLGLHMVWDYLHEAEKEMEHTLRRFQGED